MTRKEWDRDRVGIHRRLIDPPGWVRYQDYADGRPTRWCPDGEHLCAGCAFRDWQLSRDRPYVESFGLRGVPYPGRDAIMAAERTIQCLTENSTKTA